jgi:acylphosphatase
MAEACKTVSARITGRVQGVGFRAWTRREAQGLGLSGFVRNEPDGAVTALITGPEPAVGTMIDRLWDGPSGASVSGVETRDAVDAARPAGFWIEN